MIFLFLFLSLFLGLNIRYSLILGIIGILVLLIFVFRRFNKKVASISLVFFLFGVGISFINIDIHKNEYQGMVVEVKDNYFVFSSSLEKMYVYEPDHFHEIGDILYIVGYKKELDFVHLESEFDFKDYLNKKGIRYQLEYKTIEVKYYNFIKVNYLRKKFLSNFDENTASVVSGLLFGVSKNSDYIDLGRDMQIVRLISSTGIYLSLIYKIINFFISKVFKRKRINEPVSVLLLTPLLIFSFPKFAVCKFFALKGLRFINCGLLKNRFSYLDILSISAIIFLILDPNLVRQDSFILCYSIPIIYLYINGSFHMKKRWAKGAFALISIYLLCLPILIKYYSEIAILSPLIQILFAPLFSFLYLLSLLSFIGTPIYGFVSNYTSLIYNWLNSLGKFNPVVFTGSISEIGIVLYEIIFLTCLYFLSIKLKPLSKVSILVYSCFVLYFIIPFQAFKEYVSFINVGQGDSTLICYKSTTILIDTGGSKSKDVATEVLIPYFKKQQIYKIDLLITTHDDFDHSGAVTSLMNNFNVSSYITDYQAFPLTINNVTLTNYNVYPSLWSEKNDRSLVIGFNINRKDYLVMGDAPIKIENAIMNDNKYIPCDILKVGHHGSKTSTSEKFIKFLRPKIGVISCGKNNMYHHPHNEVIAILNKYQVEIRRTDLESTITF